MYAMVMMAALTTATDMPDRGRRGGCCGCYGGMSWGGCYGMGWAGCYGMGWAGCYGMGWAGCYGGYALNGVSPMIGGYAYAPMMSGYSTPFVAVNGAIVNPGTTRSLYFNPALANQANEATLIVHLPENASLSIDGQQTQSRSATRLFRSPPLERGKTYTYTLRGELNRDGHFVNVKKNVEIRAGERSEVTLSFDNAKRAAPEDDEINPGQAHQRRTPPLGSTPAERSFPTPPPDR
jgi:uncharacterized protein (TIGR03000 family)